MTEEQLKQQHVRDITEFVLNGLTGESFDTMASIAMSILVEVAKNTGAGGNGCSEFLFEDESGNKVNRVVEFKIYDKAD